MLDIFLLILAFLCILLGIIGSILPGLPGMPLAYVGLWIAQATDRIDFSWQFLLIWGAITVVLQVLDYLIPAWGTKYYGGTKYGIWGSTIGVFVGLWFGAIGVIIGPLIGAILGELLAGKQIAEAIKAGWGSFIGILFGTVIKIICCGLMAVSLIQAL